MTAIGISRLIADKVLNHSDRGIGAVYDRNAYPKEKRAALERWDRRLTAIVNRTAAPEKVVPDQELAPTLQRANRAFTNLSFLAAYDSGE
jgi:hypothetical protein